MQLMHKNRLFVPILLLTAVAISSCTTVAKFSRNEPLTVIAGNNSKTTLNVKNWHDGDELILLPGGPYVTQSISLPIATKLISKNSRYIIVIDESNELRILDFSVTPARQLSQLTLTDTATALAVDDSRVYVGFATEGIWQFDISQSGAIKKRAEFIKAPFITRIKRVNDKLYVLSDKQQLLIFDDINLASRPVKLKAQQTIQLPGECHDFNITADQLILLGPTFGLALVDISHPEKIRSHLKLQGSQAQLAINENIAYIADGAGGLVLADISNKDKLTWLGSHNKLDSIEKVLIENNKAFVIDRDLRLVSININNKTLPITGSFYKPDGTISDAVGDDSYIYLATSHGVEQVSFPGKPHAQISNEGINQGGTRRAFISGNIAYVADWFSGLHLYDISSPGHPRHISNYHTPGSSKGVVVADGYAYVGDDDHGLQIIDVSDPLHPVKVSDIATTGLAYTLKKVGHLIYLADHRGGFDIIDVEDVRHPKMLSSYDTPGKSWAIEVVGKYAFVADDSTGLLIFDISDSSKPVQISQFSPGGYAEDVAIDNHLAYISFFDKGFYIVDVSNPFKPVVMSHLEIPGNARSVTLDGNFAYVAGWESGLNVIDITNKREPALVGNYDTRGSAWGVDIYKKHAFVWDWWGGVKVINVANPLSPSLAGKYHTRGNIKGLRQKGNYIYTANGTGGIQVFDIKNALNPIWTTGADTDGAVRDIWLSSTSGYAYAASDKEGLLVYDIDDPFYIRPVARYDTGGQASLVRQYQNTVFVANEHSGLVSFNTSNPRQLEKLQEIAIDVKDMWAEHQVLFVASETQGLVAFDIDIKGLLKRRLKVIDKAADHVVASGNILISANNYREVIVWQFENNAYNAIAQLPFEEEIQDLYVTQNTLMVATHEKGLMVYDISTASNPRIYARYPATDRYGKFVVHQSAVFFGGTHTIASIDLLPAISWQKINDTSIELTLPADLPIGNYHLAIHTIQGGEQLWPNAVSVTLQKRGKPRMTMEKFEQLLKQHQSQKK